MYTWNLSDTQAPSSKMFSDIQVALAAMDIMLDLSLDKGTIKITLGIPDPSAACSPQEESTPMAPIDSETSVLVKKYGRPSCIPVHDMTLDEVRSKRDTNTSIGDIAKEIGVSKRTFYRKWNAISNKALDGATPFSEW